MVLLSVVALRKESVDRNPCHGIVFDCDFASLSARRAWIEIGSLICRISYLRVALRKESVDRNMSYLLFLMGSGVALRKESVDRNTYFMLNA